MDAKEQSLLNYYYRKLVEQTFDEKDVYSFLTLIRNRCQEIRSIHELTDFVVQREQYTGFIKDYLFEMRKRFESLGKTKQRFELKMYFPSRKSKAE
ncbi:hypothetical protein [Bacillus tuaregi]|uniref:hypothetical protein n=1 Tax=Bacillus tuaregi TaxID=1816695 RepID=UPI0008F7F344|nr:hypothetical protein [Bacillus tuaregi]